MQHQNDSQRHTEIAQFSLLKNKMMLKKKD